MPKLNLSVNNVVKNDLQLQCRQELLTGMKEITDIVRSHHEDDLRMVEEVSKVYLQANEHLDKNRIEAALALSMSYHIGQYRENGDPFIIHPFQSGFISSNLLSSKYTSERIESRLPGVVSEVKHGIVITSVLHDTLEEKFKQYKESKSELYNLMDLIYGSFGKNVLVGTLLLSGFDRFFVVDMLKKINVMPNKDILSNWDKMKEVPTYMDAFEMPYLDISKYSDNLHNLYTLHHMGRRDDKSGEERRNNYLHKSNKVTKMAKIMDDVKIYFNDINLVEIQKYFMNTDFSKI